MTVEDIRERLIDLDSVNDLRALFIEELNYEYRDQEILPQSVLSEDVGDPVENIKVIAGRDEFNIILVKLKKLLKTHERPIAKQLSRSYYHSLFVFIDDLYDEWHFCNLKHISTVKEDQEEIARRIRPFRRMVVGKGEKVRTSSEQLWLIKYEIGDSPLTIHRKVDEAFDVEAVSKRFYKDFVHYYKEFRGKIEDENEITQAEADVITQTILNRLLFLYFVQKRSFLDNDPEYLYQQFENCPSDQNYYQEYLIPLFRCLSDPDYQDEELGDIPFLNGGLFEFDEAESDIKIENSWFEAIYEDLLERYNFTVREDTEFEQEVAVDPEMLGTVFEQLILGLESKDFEDIPDPRRSTGSYYTPKFIVAFMVKESLMAFLQEKFSEIPRIKLKKLIYDLRTDQFAIDKLGDIRERLLELKSVDPGVGSGAFPVGLLLKMLEIIEVIDKKIQPEFVNNPTYRYELKRKLITKSIYGVDIQERAVHLTELRLWLSLLVEVPEPEPLPNLDLHILTGDSLVSKIGGKIDFNLEKQILLDATGEKHIDRFRKLKIEYENTHDRSEKQEIKKQVDKAKKDIIRWFLETKKKSIEKDLPQLALMDEKKDVEEQQIEERKSELAKINSLLESIDKMAGTFNWGLDFAEIMTLNGGFDLVIGNPPYGVSVPTSVKNEFRLGSRDSYGVFSALGLTVLRDHGILSYIMSDTWQTIRTHKELRERFLKDTDTLYLISVPNDTFKATVNPGVYLFRKRHPVQRKAGGDNWIIAADFSPLSIKDGDVEVAFDMLAELDESGIDDNKDGQTIWSDKVMAIFKYRQNLIPRFSNLSFFIASPKLFRLMQDEGNLQTEALISLSDGTNPNKFKKTIYEINFNGEELKVVRIQDIANVVVGLQTGDNPYYIRQSKENLQGSSRNYDVVDWDKVLDDDEIEKIANDEALRLSLIQVGLVEDLNEPIYGNLTVRFKKNKVEIHDCAPNEIDEPQTILGKFDKRECVEVNNHDVIVTSSDRYFEGRIFVPYDKGGASDIDEGWLPNYYVPTDYYIDWSERAVKRLRTLTIADRIRFYDEDKEIKPHYESTTCAVLRNTDYYFLEGISYSRTGQYCPTFRIGSSGMFDTEGCSIFPEIPIIKLISMLPSRLFRYMFKAYIDHTVHLQVEDVKKFPVILDVEDDLVLLAENIIDKQKKDSRYDYMNNELVKINELVYRLYNLDKSDIQEVNNWFHRTYPKLANVLEN